LHIFQKGPKITIVFDKKEGVRNLLQIDFRRLGYAASTFAFAANGDEH